MMQQLNRKVNQQRKVSNERQEAFRQDILRKQQNEQDFKDEVLRLLNQINSKLSVNTDDEFEDVREMFYSLGGEIDE